jgi:carboxylesterase
MQASDQSIRLPGGQLGFLLIHGLGGTPLELRYVAHGLARAGHRVHVPQLSGHCGTVDELKVTGWLDWYASVEAEHDLMKAAGCESIIVGGLSVGSILALHLAAVRPDSISGLALYAPSLWLDGWGVPWHAALFKLVSMKWCADLFPFAERHPWGVKDERLRALIEKAIRSGDSSRAGVAALPGRLMLELRYLVQRVKGEIGEVRQPALIVHPREDDRASLRNLHYLQASLGGLTETVVLDDSYHLVTLDRQRQIVLARTLEFAERLQQGSWRTLATEDAEEPVETEEEKRKAE